MWVLMNLLPHDHCFWPPPKPESVSYSGPFLFPPKTHHSYVHRFVAQHRFAHPNCVSAASSQGCLLLDELHMCAPTGLEPRNPASLTRESSQRERENWGSGLSRGRLLTMEPFPMWRRWGLVTEHGMGSQELVPVLALSWSS